MNEERKHSVLAPSSKEWVHCGFAAKFLANKEDETNDASEFGTECHALAEAYIKQSLKIEDFDEKPVSIDELKSTFKHYDDEMETLATGYANYVVGQADYEEKRTGKKPIVFVEQLLDMDYAPDTHGTADAIIISGDTLTIIDNKTGFIPVKVFEGNELNSQLGIYGLYAYKLFADIYPIKKIRLVIYQERIHNIDDQTVDVEDLLEWDGFNKMIADARAGLIDLIITKSVSRFARNTLDTISHLELSDRQSHSQQGRQHHIPIQKRQRNKNRWVKIPAFLSIIVSEESRILPNAPKSWWSRD